MRNLYECECCRAVFTNEQECIKHEATVHSIPECIVDNYKYFSIDERYPSRLRVKFNDNAEVDYIIDVVIQKPYAVEKGVLA